MASSLNPKADFFRRLGYYAVGITIGFLLLGMFQKLRVREFEARQSATTPMPVGQATPPAESADRITPGPNGTQMPPPSKPPAEGAIGGG